MHSRVWLLHGKVRGTCTAPVVLGKISFEEQREEIWGGNQGLRLLLLTSARGFTLLGAIGAFLDGQSLQGGGEFVAKRHLSEFFFPMEKGQRGEKNHFELSRPALLRNLHLGPLGKNQTQV